MLYTSSAEGKALSMRHCRNLREKANAQFLLLNLTFICKAVYSGYLLLYNKLLKNLVA